MIFILDPANWSDDWSRLPGEAQSGFLSSNYMGGGIIRLSASYFAIRQTPGRGPWLVGTLLDLHAELLRWPIPEPYAPREASRTAPTTGADLLKDLGL